ncbi:MAG: hypothetical protein KAU17_11995 [Spirochaetales bacterium]|nr:hypothetical protein [Spirochaetales bacterium]
MKKLILFFFTLVVVLPGFGQQIREMEFVNQSIVDILFTIAQTTGTSIVPDDSVTGNASYYFTDTELETALDNFLTTYNLVFWERDGVYYVSKVLVTYDAEKEMVTVHARDVEPQTIIERLSKEIHQTILFDSLPRERITIHSIDLPVQKVLEIIMLRFSDYLVETFEDYYYVKRHDRQAGQTSSSRGSNITREGDSYSLVTGSIRLSEAIRQLFEDSGREYSLMKRGDSILEHISFQNKGFDELLRLLLEQAEGDFTVRDDIYYIFDLSRNDILKKLDDVHYIRLRNVPVELMPSLFPAGLANTSVFKIDKGNNAIILSGSFEEIAPVKDYILKIDAEYSRKETRRLDLAFLTVDELISLLPSRLKNIPITRIRDSRSFIVEAGKGQFDDFTFFVTLADRFDEGTAVFLKYIRDEDLLKNLPPSIKESDIRTTSDPNMVFFLGSEEMFSLFQKELELIDKPIPQIRYQLLVVQYQESKNRNWSFSAENEVLGEDSSNLFLGVIGNLLNLNFDIVSTFGYQFAVNLNLNLGDSKARILADTTLNGLSGQDISFQNTNTYRYRDMEIDPDTGDLKSTGITREITSGLFIKINGWVSGDGMITMDVQSTVSKRGADVSTSGVNPPPTSEKVINTHVRTPSGKPVIIGGLLQQDKDIVVQKVPILGDIPLLGFLFRSEKETYENTELVIYIVPHIEYPDIQVMAVPEILKDYYKTFVQGMDLWN